ncbi:hypothetical protein F5Y18DRAFT_423450 [Xylariaceae sp. FL1019]|nr:hypothetical protein F5Y18DRAFT_423450 [Xylariaceae sp. FL1019]
MRVAVFAGPFVSLPTIVVLAVPYDTAVLSPNADAEPNDGRGSLVAPIRNRSSSLQRRSGAFTFSCKSAFIQNPSGQYDLIGDCKKKNGDRLCSLVALDRCLAVEDGHIVAKNMWVDGGGLAKGQCINCSLDGSILECKCAGATGTFDLNNVIGNDDGYLTCFEHRNRFKSDDCLRTICSRSEQEAPAPTLMLAERRSDRVSPAALREAEEVKTHFERSYRNTFRVERIIGQGSWGVTLLMSAQTSDNPDLQPSVRFSPLRRSNPAAPLPIFGPRSSFGPSPPTRPSSSGFDLNPRLADLSLNPPEPLQPMGPPPIRAPASFLDPPTRPRPSTSGGPPSTAQSGFGLSSLGAAQLPAPPTKRTRFVMKRALAPTGERSINQEIDVLNRLRGSMHIAQPSALIDDRRLKNILAGLRGPALVMEWIENGLLQKFLERKADEEAPLPNRMLWSIFLCLCRMVVAMAWPPGDRTGGGQRLELEVVPPGPPPKSRLVHNDFHSQNIMIDGLDLQEHSRVPILKLIDFGMSRDLPVRNNEPRDIAQKVNIFAIGKVLLNLIGGHERAGLSDMDATDEQGVNRKVRSYATDLNGLSDSYKAPAMFKARHQQKLDNLDLELKNLVVLCCAERPDDRPSIEFLLRQVEESARNKSPGDYADKRFHANETDPRITELIERYMLVP